jgi:hypothetical protein
MIPVTIRDGGPDLPGIGDHPHPRAVPIGGSVPWAARPIISASRAVVPDFWSLVARTPDGNRGSIMGIMIPDPRQIGDGDASGPPIPGESGMGVGMDPRL